MLITDGRSLPIEKVLFKDKSVLAGSDADWRKHIVKENVISAVPLNNWVLVFCKRDSPRAMDFVNTLKKVTLMMAFDGNKSEEYSCVRVEGDKRKVTLRDGVFT